MALVLLAPLSAPVSGGQPIIARVAVKVIPGSSRTCIAGWQADVLRVRVTAAPEKGKANAAVEATVAEALGVPARCVRIVSGLTGQRKILEIAGLSEPDVRMRLKGR
jgi:uncharacterized protein YggU (UPF0235/DUF167 family)